MDHVETTVALAIAAVLFAVATFFLVRQKQTLAAIRYQTEMPAGQRAYLWRQFQRRLVGSMLLFLLGGLLVCSLFLDYEPLRQPLQELPPEQQDAAKQAFRVITIYWMTFLMLLMVALALAVFDFWDTARFGMQQQKLLFQQHQEMLEADLAELKYRHGGSSNGTPK